MTDLAEFIDTLRMERHRFRIRQGELADAIGTSAQLISAYETGRYRPTPELLEAWAAGLGLPVPDDLVWPDGHPRVAACGTDSGYYRHRKRHELVCEACRKAHSAAQADWRARRRAS